MHGDKSTRKVEDGPQATAVMKANECIMRAQHLGPPKLLFDEFWREGELCLLFGAPGAGKSVLATQIAEGLARGRGVDGLKMTAGRQKVLYVDMQLSERHFIMRYSSDPDDRGRTKTYRFSENLYRQRPPADADLYKWLRETVVANGFRSVVIDDLSAVRTTFDGTRETLKLMRQLRRLCEDLDISILVLAGAREPWRRQAAVEADMQRSRVLCDAADSVFAIGRHPQTPEDRYLLQTRSRGAVITWHAGHVPVCSFAKRDGIFLALQFDERFQPALDDEKRDLICGIKAAHDRGATFRDIAELYGISKTTAARLSKMWKPKFQKAYERERAEPPASAAGKARPTVQPQPETKALDTMPDAPSPPVTTSEVEVETPAVPDPPAIEPPKLDSPRAILLALGYRRTYDENDREIFVEQEEDGHRRVWYRFDVKSSRSPVEQLKRVRYNGSGTTTEQYDGQVCLFNTS